MFVMGIKLLNNYKTINPMKKTRILQAAFLLLVLLVSSCGGIKKMKDNVSEVKYKVTPSPLVMKAGEVEVNIETSFPPKYFNKKAILVVTPVLKYGEEETYFDSIAVQGESVQDNYKKIPNAGGSFTYNGVIPYEDEMLVSTLELKMYAKIKNKMLELPSATIAEGVISTAKLVKKIPATVTMPDKYQRVKSMSVETDIKYLINKDDVRASELKKDGFVAFKKELLAVAQSPSKKLTGLSLSAYASPDGPLDMNEKLSGNRGKSSSKSIINEFKKVKFDSAIQANLKTQVTAEDWDGFQQAMKSSSIKDKELILRVLSMYTDPVVREKEIKNIAAAYKEIKEEILPPLRRSKLIASIDSISWSDEELITLAQTNPDILGLEELLRAGSLTDGLNEKLAIFQKAADKFPEDFRAINNVGCVQLSLKNIAEAKAAIEKAQSLEDNDYVKNNLGAVLLAEGDLKGAKELLTAGIGAGYPANYNLGIIAIINGDYKSATTYFGNEPSYNAGLAKLLYGQYDDAINTLGQTKEDEALVFYVKAVAGAKALKDDVVFHNLRTAVEKDSSLKEYAKKDLEFVKYRSIEGFIAIIQ